MTSEERQHFMSQEFRRIFGGDPVGWARAPGHVDLMGSHTDYNMGYVMTMTIDRDTWLAAGPRSIAVWRCARSTWKAAVNSASIRSTTTRPRRGPTTCAGWRFTWRRPATV